ncbi:hypothetical protein [Isoptericola sp. BMS4]|uniref:hypothetical protein n=1 Tax=Isoptericola sp. BMS4 TaxID=2527875 RepID=UPI0014242784|nr:hypothetical protein [Isoptericola sp. BMS4]
MASVQAFVPSEHTSEHVLVAPSGAHGVPELAAARFAGVEWLRAPRDGAATGDGRPVGARFRGMRSSASASASAPGVLRLGREHRATGPFPVDDASSLGLSGAGAAWALGRLDGGLDVRGGRPGVYDDRDGIARAFAAALPEGEELEIVRWAVAVARRLGGALLADGRHVMRPDPRAAVDLTLWSARTLPQDELLAAVRSCVATAQAAPAGPPGALRVVARTAYDGDLVIDVAPAERLPLAVAGSASGAASALAVSGAVVHRLSWVPLDREELAVEHPSGIHEIARARCRALLARVAALLQPRLEAVVLDDGGLPVGPDDLERRLAGETASGRAWV